MFLPSWNKRMTTKPYASLYRRFPHICKFLGTIPSDQLLYAELPFWNNIQTPLPKHTWEVHIVATWNTEGRNCLKYACNKNWLKDLAIEIFEVKQEINCTHNDPYPSALSTEETPGLYKISKLPNDHLRQTSQDPQDKTSTLDLFHCSNKATQQSSSPNLIRKIQDCRDWTYTDGSLRNTKKGKTQDQVYTTLA